MCGSKEICTAIYATGGLGKGIVEQSVVLRTTEGLMVITGCAHPCVVNIVRTVKEIGGEDRVHLVLGGFHLGGQPATRIKSILREFRHLSVQKVAPCHCSGDERRRLLAHEYAAGYIESGVGRKINLGGLNSDPW